jgi:hypothetical protein
MRQGDWFAFARRTRAPLANLGYTQAQPSPFDLGWIRCYNVS